MGASRFAQAASRGLRALGLRSLLLATSVWGLATTSACKAPPTSKVPDDAALAVVTLDRLDCGQCGDSAARELGEFEGVYLAVFDAKRVQLRVEYDAAKISEAELLASLEPIAARENFAFTLGGGDGTYLPSVEFGAELDVVQISSAGEFVELEANLAPGKVTVFDFHAQWCGPCRELDKHMRGVLKAQTDVALRRLDVVDWDSEVAKAYLRDVPALPYVEVFDARGKRVARISGLELDRIDAAIAKAKGEGS